MPNMSYCRFENTAQDLDDCVNAIREGEIKDLNEYEIPALKNLIELCKEVIDSEEYIIETLNEYENE